MLLLLRQVLIIVMSGDLMLTAEASILIFVLGVLDRQVHKGLRVKQDLRAHKESKEYKDRWRCGSARPTRATRTTGFTR
jgi:hypothetical protein